MPASSRMPRAEDGLPVSLLRLSGLFLRIACTSFGGFMAMVSVTQNVIVERHKLLPDREVLDAVALASVLPGPIAINVVAYIGYRLRGIAGAIVCVICAVLPAFLFMVALGTFYFRWGSLPAFGKMFMGITPVVAAIVAAAAWRLCKASVRSWREGLLTLGAAALLMSYQALFVAPALIVVAGAIGWGWFREPATADDLAVGKVAAEAAANEAVPTASSLPSVPPAGVGMLFAMALPMIGFEASVLLKLFFVFAGMSLLMFGGGYVFIPLLQHTVVDGQAWVTHREFVDAIALTQLTPGPVVISAAFIGMKVGGVAGAAAATIGIFAPSATLMVASAHVLNRIKHSRAVQAALRGVRAAVAGMVISAAFVIGKTAAPVWLSAILFAAALLALVRFRAEAVWMVPAAGLIGLLFY